MKRLLLNQPGRFGDILICLPIAKSFSKEYAVDWLCPPEYHSVFRNINYCRPVVEETGIYDKIIDLSFGIVTGTKLHEWWINNRKGFSSFINAKYQLADVPVDERWNLRWTRDLKKERSLYQHIVNLYGIDYILCHEVSHDGISISVKRDNKVLFSPIQDYNIFDWFAVIINAKEIHCIDSSLANFVEVIQGIEHITKYYYITRKVPNIWDRTILSNDWEIVNE